MEKQQKTLPQAPIKEDDYQGTTLMKEIPPATIVNDTMKEIATPKPAPRKKAVKKAESIGEPDSQEKTKEPKPRSVSTRKKPVSRKTSTRKSPGKSREIQEEETPDQNKKSTRQQGSKKKTAARKSSPEPIIPELPLN